MVLTQRIDVASLAPPALAERTGVHVRLLDGAELWSLRGWSQAWRMYRRGRIFWRLRSTPSRAPVRLRYRRMLRPVEPGVVVAIAPGEVWATNLDARPVDAEILVVDPSLDDDGCERLAECLDREELSPFIRPLLHAPEPLWYPPPEASGCESAVRKARDYIEERFATSLNLDAIAGISRRSKFHLARSFAERVGVSIWEYVLLVRLDRAMNRLRAGARPVEVASETAFSDQAHLTRTFREIYGITPARYARP